jgi:hypothetical protein
MKVALYPSHHCLPFWHEPANPEILFDPSALEGWTYEKNNGFEKGEVRPATELHVMAVLNGLFALEIPGVMAHTSIIFNPQKKSVSFPKRVWVQITTEPSEEDESGLPVVVKDGKVQVMHLWGGDNRTYTPFELLGNRPVEGEKTPEFWTKFFLAKLREAKKAACEDAEKTRSKAERILKSYSTVQ